MPTEGGTLGRAFHRISTPHSGGLTPVPQNRLFKFQANTSVAASPAQRDSGRSCLSLSGCWILSWPLWSCQAPCPLWTLCTFLHICTRVCTKCFCFAFLLNLWHMYILHVYMYVSSFDSRTCWVLSLSCPSQTLQTNVSQCFLQADQHGEGMSLNLKKSKCHQRLLLGHKNN